MGVSDRNAAFLVDGIAGQCDPVVWGREDPLLVTADVVITRDGALWGRRDDGSAWRLVELGDGGYELTLFRNGQEIDRMVSRPE